MLLELLKASFNNAAPAEELFKNISQNDWYMCRELAIRQGVMALAWDGAMLLPKALQPYRQLKIKWGLAVEKYEQKYKTYCKIANELSSLYKSNHIDTIVLKGLGLSSFYPVPSHREGGDIDIYTYSADKNILDNDAANKLADELILQQGIKIKFKNIKHSEFFYKGIPIENHKKFIAVDLYDSAVSIEKYLEDVADAITARIDDAYDIMIPSDRFNMIFIPYHTMQHYGDGMTLHHLYDWASIIKRNGLKIPSEIKDKNFISFINNLTQLANTVFGTEVSCEYSEKIQKEMMREIVCLPYSKYDIPKNKIGVFLFKTRRMLHRYNIRKKFFNESLYKTLGFAISYHIKNPDTTFK